jgi:hypothetical protein
VNYSFPIPTVNRKKPKLKQRFVRQLLKANEQFFSQTINGKQSSLTATVLMRETASYILAHHTTDQGMIGRATEVI